MTTETYTDQQAADEAVLLLTRKLRRLHPAAFADVIGKLPEGARQALGFAEQRADVRRSQDERDDVTREYIDRYADLDSEV